MTVTHLTYTVVIPDVAAWSTAYFAAPEDGGDRTEEQYWPQHNAILIDLARKALQGHYDPDMVYPYVIGAIIYVSVILAALPRGAAVPRFDGLFLTVTAIMENSIMPGCMSDAVMDEAAFKSVLSRRAAGTAEEDAARAHALQVLYTLRVEGGAQPQGADLAALFAVPVPLAPHAPAQAPAPVAAAQALAPPAVPVVVSPAAKASPGATPLAGSKQVRDVVASHGEDLKTLKKSTSGGGGGGGGGGGAGGATS